MKFIIVFINGYVHAAENDFRFIEMLSCCRSSDLCRNMSNILEFMYREHSSDKGIKIKVIEIKSIKIKTI